MKVETKQTVYLDGRLRTFTLTFQSDHETHGLLADIGQPLIEGAVAKAGVQLGHDLTQLSENRADRGQEG